MVPPKTKEEENSHYGRHFLKTIRTSSSRTCAEGGAVITMKAISFLKGPNKCIIRLIIKKNNLPNFVEKSDFREDYIENTCYSLCICRVSI